MQSAVAMPGVEQIVGGTAAARYVAVDKVRGRVDRHWIGAIPGKCAERGAEASLRGRREEGMFESVVARPSPRRRRR